MHTDEATNTLRGIPLFSACDDVELDVVVGATEQASYLAGEVLMSEGEPGWEFFVITSGAAEVSRRGSVVKTLQAGDFVGELALLDHAPRNATVTAVKPVTVLLLAYDEFWRVISSAPGLDKKLLAALARRLREADGTVT